MVFYNNHFIDLMNKIIFVINQRWYYFDNKFSGLGKQLFSVSEEMNKSGWKEISLKVEKGYFNSTLFEA